MCFDIYDAGGIFTHTSCPVRREGRPCVPGSLYVQSPSIAPRATAIVSSLLDTEASGLHVDGHGQILVELRLALVGGQVNAVETRVSLGKHLHVLVNVHSELADIPIVSLQRSEPLRRNSRSAYTDRHNPIKHRTHRLATRTSHKLK